MRRLVLSSLALIALSSGGAYAADLAVPAAPVPVASPVAANWTGFYAGIFGGLAASTDALDMAAPGAGTVNANITGNGWLGGGRIGYDYDLGGPVLGAYADFAGANIGAQIDGSEDLGGGATATFNIHDTLQTLGTVQGKAGYAFGDLMAYVHGGFAYGHTETGFSESISGGPSVSGSTSQNRTGWTIGAGLAYQLPNNIEISTEYGYYDLGTASVANVAGVPINDRLTFNTATVGLNYRF
ncbi:MAG TPA: outer membrane beta-barrel protein [Devosiaceae bacterium]|nr:outer membrane beta-barrel protein [Devosiaceae bacterium]